MPPRVVGRDHFWPHTVGDRNPSRVSDLFEAALGRPPGERDAFLDDACGEDAELRRRVETLLARDETAGSFLESPLGETSAALAALASKGTERTGHKIGRYRILGWLGSGGTSQVYLARREGVDFEQRVALKLLQGFLMNTEVVERFRRERQILARLKHPNIARLFDGGTTEDGAAYLVTEYVEGRPLTEYCDEKRLTVRGRLELFRRICAAVQHANQNLVLHRDLKPSNILVTEEGEPKLLDFGVAKLLGPEGQVDSTVTVQRMLTPSYASPEQIAGEPTTTASDSFSLGVLLYRLLTGRLPFDRTRANSEPLSGTSVPSLPLRPSSAVTSQPSSRARTDGPEDLSAEEIAAARGVRPEALARQLAGDLDVILRKALEVDPEQRYQAARDLADDLTRQLEGRPIRARPPSWRYRATKFVQRQRVGIGVAFAVILLVSGFTWRTVVEREKASRAARQAEIAAAQAQEATDFLVGLFDLSDPFSAEASSSARVGTVPIEAFLERGTRALERLGGQPEVQSTVRAALGRVNRGLGRYEEAERLFREALAQRRNVFGDDSVEAAEGLHDLATVLSQMSGSEGDEEAANPYAEAEQLLRQALSIRRDRLGNEDDQVASTLSSLALVRRYQGEHVEAETLYREAVAIHRRSPTPRSLELATALNGLGSLLSAKSEHAEAEELLKEALELRRDDLGAEHPQVVTVLNNLAVLASDQGRYSEAEALNREVLRVREAVLGEDHPQVATSLNNLAQSLHFQERFSEAEPVLRRAAEIRRRALGESHPLVARTLSNLGVLLGAKGDLAGAEKALQEAFALQSAGLGAEHPDAVDTLTRIGDLQWRQGELTRAEATLRTALSLQRQLRGEEHFIVGIVLRYLGAVHLEQRSYDEAEATLTASLAIFEGTVGLEHPFAKAVIESLISLHTTLEQPVEAGRLRVLLEASDATEP